MTQKKDELLTEAVQDAAPYPLISDAGDLFDEGFFFRCGAGPTYIVFLAQAEEYLIKAFLFRIFTAIPRYIGCWAIFT